MLETLKKLVSKGFLKIVKDTFVPAVSKAIGELEKQAKTTDNPYDDMAVGLIKQIWTDTTELLFKK